MKWGNLWQRKKSLKNDRGADKETLEYMRKFYWLRKNGITLDGISSMQLARTTLIMRYLQLRRRRSVTKCCCAKQNSSMLSHQNGLHL